MALGWNDKGPQASASIGTCKRLPLWRNVSLSVNGPPGNHLCLASLSPVLSEWALSLPTGLHGVRWSKVPVASLTVLHARRELLVPCFAFARPFRVGTFVANRFVRCEAEQGTRGRQRKWSTL